MPWTCEKCGSKNPTNALTCGKCGGKTKAERKLAIPWVLGGAVLFFLAFLVGSFLGGTMVAMSVEPSDDDVFTAAKAAGIEAKTLADVSPSDQKAGREAALEKAKKDMSAVVRIVLFWFIPLILFPVAGAVVGFVSEGRTVYEASFACLIGYPLSFVVMKFGYGLDVSWIEFAVALVVGFVLAGIGAYMGEAVQEKRERVELMFAELDEAQLNQ